MYLLSRGTYCHVPFVMYLLPCTNCHVVSIAMYLFSRGTYCHVPIVSWYLWSLGTYCHVVPIAMYLLSRGTYCLVVPIVSWYLLSLGTYCHLVHIVTYLSSKTYSHLPIVTYIYTHKYLLSSTYCHLPILPNRITLISIVMGAYFGSEMCARHYLKCETCFKMYLHQYEHCNLASISETESGK